MIPRLSTAEELAEFSLGGIVHMVISASWTSHRVEMSLFQLAY